jgi:hypothetical protein
MAKAVAELEADIRALPDADKERLLRVLLEELDGPPDPDAERLWLEEIERRSREIDEGLVETIPGEQVFAELKARFSRR